MRRLIAPLAATLLLASACATGAAVETERADPIAPSPTVPGSTVPGSTVPDTTVPDTTVPDTTVPGPDDPPVWPGGDTGVVPPTETRIDTPIDLAEVVEVGPDKTDRPYDDFVAAAAADIEDWFAELYLDLYGDTWVPLSGGIWPSYPGRTDIPGCGEARTDPADVVEFVAFYCAGRDFMVYDDGPTSLLGELAEEFGASVLGVVLAHEYGHVVQDRIGAFDLGLPTILTEQQADCVSGAWVARAATGGSRYVTLSDADVRGALITMVAVRDPVGLDQFEPGGHGSAFDRIGAFREGFLLGPERCAELLDDPLPLMPNEFQTTTDMLNEGDLPFGYDAGDIVPLVVDALNDYWAFRLAELGAGTFTPMALVPVMSRDDIECSATPRLVAPGLATCTPDSTVFLDDGYARRLYQDPIVGSADFAVGYFIALAWADVVQNRLGSTLRDAERALASDCLVGSWTRDLDPDRPEREGEGLRAVISPGDLDEAVVAAIEIGDTSPDDDRLGVPFDKVGAFREGVLTGIDTCLDRLAP